MELATALVWTLRIVLPIVLFCIYFKLQSPKEERDIGPTNNVIPRNRFLHLRKASVGAPAPGPVENITLKDPSQAPALFAGAGSRSGRGGRRAPDESRGRERREKRSADARKPQQDPQETTVDVESANPPQGPEDKMHLESLLNFVAFSRPEQQRIFLPDESGAPPPPPPPSKKPKEKELDISGVTAEKANSEAQMVLRGALGFQQSGIAKHLYEQLCEAQVDISESSFELMIETCVLAEDLKGSSDFLMKMENAGHTPNSDLFDKVMDLYSRHKVNRDGNKRGQADAMPDVVIPFGIEAGDIADEGLRTRLSSAAPVFVPSFIPPPPPVSGDITAPEASEDLAQQRSKLTADAKPFEPKFNVSFDPYMCAWPVEQSEEWSQDWSKGNNGKGKEKGKAKGKGKGENKHSNDKQHETSSTEPSKYDKNESKGHWKDDGAWNWKEKEGKKPAAKVWRPKVESSDAA